MGTAVFGWRQRDFRAMTHPAARGERFLAVAGEPESMLSIARILKSHLGSAGGRAPTRQLPDFFVRLATIGSPALRQCKPQLGKIRNASNAKAKTSTWMVSTAERGGYRLNRREPDAVWAPEKLTALRGYWSRTRPQQQPDKCFVLCSDQAEQGTGRLDSEVAEAKSCVAIDLKSIVLHLS